MTKNAVYNIPTAPYIKPHPPVWFYAAVNLYNKCISGNDIYDFYF